MWDILWDKYYEGKKKYKEINLDEQRIKGHKKKVLYVPRFFFFLMYKRQFLGHLVTHIIELVNFLRCLYLPLGECTFLNKIHDEILSSLQ